MNEADVEQAAIEYFEALGYDYRPGNDIAHDGTAPEAQDAVEAAL